MTALQYAADSARSSAAHAGPLSHASRRVVVLRTLASADAAALTVAFSVSALTPVGSRPLGHAFALVLALAIIGTWLVVTHTRGLYDRDSTRTDHSTVDELTAIFQAVTTGTWLAVPIAVVVGIPEPETRRLILFWLTGVVGVAAARVVARGAVRRSAAYRQRTLIVGAGEIGQLVARKFLFHHEYGVEVVGFVDGRPKERRVELKEVDVVGTPRDLPDLVRELDVERVVFAFSDDRHDQVIDLIRSLGDTDIEIDVVPRLFDVMGPNAELHDVEGLPLVNISAAQAGRGARFLKRAIDVLGASALLLLTAPLFALIALWVRRDSPGGIFFRQQRLGLGMQPFTAIKLRTMRMGTDTEEHRRYIASTMSAAAAPRSNGLYKLERTREITRSGYWLRKTSLDELPQLLNVLKGDMSLVGPRPCLDYETEFFEPHHFERFNVPAGITGLWQVTARARSTFGEALDLDVAYARGWTIGLDLKLLLRTPRQLVRLRETT